KDREDAVRSIPAVFASRLVVCPFANLPVGFENSSYDDVEGNPKYWHVDVSEYANRACSVADRAGHRPAILIIVASPGGHAALALAINRVFRSRLRLTTYVITTVPDDPQMRKAEFPKLMRKLRD